MVPDSPIGGVVCQYLSHPATTSTAWLAGSATLGDAEIRSIQQAVNHPGGRPSADAAAWPFAWYRFTYADGHQRTIATVTNGPAIVTGGNSTIASDREVLHLPTAFSP